MRIAAVGRERAVLLTWPPPFAANPYLAHLAEALAAEHVTTVSARHLAVLLARSRGSRWLHLHWPEWLLRSTSRSLSRARAFGFFALLDHVRRSGVTIAWTAHNLIGHDEPHEDLAWAARREFLSRCDVVFGHFASAEGDVRSLGFGGTFALTPHPAFESSGLVATDRTHARAALGYAPDHVVLLAFGAIEPYKGYDGLVDRFRALEDGSVRLHISGEPRSQSALAGLTGRAIGDPRIRVEARHVDDEQTALLMAAADAAIFSYRSFYTSGSAILALSHGVPVVGEPVHHFTSFVGQPFFIPLAPTESLNAAVASVRALSPEARGQARVFAHSTTWASMAQQIARTLFDSDPST